MCAIELTSPDHQVVKFLKTQILLNVTEKAADNQPSEVSCTLKLIALIAGEFRALASLPSGHQGGLAGLFFQNGILVTGDGSLVSIF